MITHSSSTLNFGAIQVCAIQIDILIEATDSFYCLMPPDADGHYDVQHGSSVSVVAPDGTLRAKLQSPFDPGLTVEFLTQLQIQYRKGLTR